MSPSASHGEALLPGGAGAGVQELRTGAVARTWWPLAMSWLLMGAEQPALAAVMARLAEPELNLAAFGGIVFPIALLVEAPVIMLLAASTALARDRRSFEKLARFGLRLALALTLVHAAIAFTPLYDLCVVPLLGPDPRTVEPGRLGLQLMTLWTFAIADRRLRQGVLIRFGHARAVGLGTLVRLIATGAALGAGALLGLPGIAVASGALAVGVLVEMAFARWAAAPLLAGALAGAPSSQELTTRRMLHFYVPLALTPLIVLAAQPIGAAAINRMPLGLASLAVWPVLNGLVFLARTAGMAYNEVVVRHAAEPGARPVLVRFGWILALCSSGALLLIAATPLSDLWLAGVSGLPPELARLAHGALWLGLLLPATTVAHSLYTGHLVAAHRTRGVTESVGVFLAVSSALLLAGVLAQRFDGASVALFAFSCGALAQLWWLRRRVRGLESAERAAQAAHA